MHSMATEDCTVIANRIFSQSRGEAGPESTKRAKIRLAILLKILHIVPSERRNCLANIEKETWKGCI